jgi:UDP-N-acetylmuramoyl-L-alanyl-D-glutamate--2,6-diaminopimelate ligase
MMTSHYSRRPVALCDLLPNLALEKAATITVGNLCLDTRQLKTGDAFIALVGNKVDGRDFIAKAIELGASVILVEADKNWQGIDWLGSVPVIAVEQLASQVSAIAARFFDEPSKKVQLLGITGTNGKTTCSLLAAQLLARLQRKSAVVGTLGYGVLDATALAPMAQQVSALHSTGLTTPDPIALQRILAELVHDGATAIVIAQLATKACCQREYSHGYFYQSHARSFGLSRRFNQLRQCQSAIIECPRFANCSC